MSDQPLERRLAMGVAWTAALKWGSQALSWLAMIVLARLLSPSDYGLVGMATLYLGLIRILSEAGIGTSIVAIREISGDERAQINTMALYAGLAGTAVTCLAAIPLGRFFRSPELPWVVVVLSFNSVLGALRLVPAAVLQKQLRFRALAAVDGAGAILNTVVTLAGAVLGWRYWSLVAGGIASNIGSAGVACWLAPERFAVPRRESIGKYYRFTRDVLIGRIAWYAYSNADFLVAGRMLGKAALGAYSFAWNIASVPVEKVAALVARVTPAIFARVQNDPSELRRMYLLVTEGLVFLTLPASVGMAFVAEDFVTVYLGPKWSEAVVPLKVLALYAALRSVGTLLAQILTVRRDTEFLMRNSIVTAILLPVAFLIGSRWGAGGIALGWVVVYPLCILPVYLRTFRTLSLSVAEYWQVLLPTVRGVAVMAAALFVMGRLLPSTFPPWQRLIVLSGLGAAVYLLAGVLPQRGRLAEVVRIVRNPKPAPAPEPVSG